MKSSQNIAIEPAFTLALNPAGHLVCHADENEGSLVLDAGVARRIKEAFTANCAAGLLHLGTIELEEPLPALLAFWRDFSRNYLTRLCLAAASGEDNSSIPVPVREEVDRLLVTCPPMPGFEYLTSQVMENLWKTLDQFTREKVNAAQKDIQSWLTQQNPLWNMVGRVTFHLAENRRDPEHPFAFLVTYTTRLSNLARPQYLPLGKALMEYAAGKEKQSMLALLTPLQRAAEKSALIRDLVDSGKIFHPLAWTPAEAHRFLLDIPSFETSGVIVRIPDWWRANAGKPVRPQVKVTVGDVKKQGLGLDTLMDFSVQLSLDGELLTDEEWRKILEGTSGLVLLRGKWVEVNREKLAAVLAYWEKASKGDFQEGISLAQGMRLLSGAGIEEKNATAAVDSSGQWQQVVAGQWLDGVLKELRHPDKIGVSNPGDMLKTILRPYQQTGVNWLWFMNRLGLGACLADDMGLGKTIQILALLLIIKKEMSGARTDPSPALLIVPASLVANWKAEITRFAPSLAVFYAHPSETSPEKLAGMKNQKTRQQCLAGIDLTITTYAMLHRQDWLRDIPWSLAVLDEAQSIKNPATRQTRAVKALQAANRILLTGTPVENRLGDLWSLFDFLSPGLLGSAAVFTHYVKKCVNDGGNSYASLRSLVRPYILRRLKTDREIITDLPDKIEIKAFCPLTKTQAALYEQSVQQLARQLREAKGIERRGIVLAYLMRFKQICNHPSQWLGDYGYTSKDSGKFQRLEQICEEIAAKQEKVLIFSQFREMTNPLEVVLRDVFGRKGLVLHGETPVKKRRELINAFQTEDGPPFFVLSLKTGGVGLNLTAASHVIHFDRWWNPAVENQATDRAFRIGQKKNVLVHKFICRGTIEEKIDFLIEEKKDLAESILGYGKEKSLTEMPDDELLRFVALDLSRALDD